MTSAAADELRLVEAADGVEFGQANLAEATRLLDDWMAALAQAMSHHGMARPQSFGDAHPLVREIGNINGLLATSADDWAAQWALLEPAHALADRHAWSILFGARSRPNCRACSSTT